MRAVPCNRLLGSERPHAQHGVVPQRVDTIIAGWSHADEAAQVIGALAHHARSAVLRLDEADELVHGPAGAGRHARHRRPSDRWAALLDELQVALGRATEVADDFVREAESDWALRAAAAFLMEAAFDLAYAEVPDDGVQPDALDRLTSPALAIARRLRNFADDVPVRPGEPGLDLLDTHPSQGEEDTASRLQWLPLIGSSMVLLICAAVLVPLGLHSTAFVAGILVAPVLYVVTLQVVGRLQAVRPPLWLLERPSLLDEIARCGRVIDRNTGYIRLFQASSRELVRLVETWQMHCESSPNDLSRVSLELGRLQRSLRGGDDAADKVVRALSHAAYAVSNLALAQTEAPPTSLTLPRKDLSQLVHEVGQQDVRGLLDLLSETTRRTAELAVGVTLHVVGIDGGPAPAQTAALAEHLRRIEKNVASAIGQADRALNVAVRAVAHL